VRNEFLANLPRLPDFWAATACRIAVPFIHRYMYGMWLLMRQVQRARPREVAWYITEVNHCYLFIVHIMLRG
jgi:hypothetical protein